MSCVREERLDHLLGALVAEYAPPSMSSGMIPHGANADSANAMGSSTTSLLRSEPTGDLGDDRDLACRRQAEHVTRRHGGVVDHHARALGASLHRLGGDVVEGAQRSGACPTTSSTDAAPPSRWRRRRPVMRSIRRSRLHPVEHSRHKAVSGVNSSIGGALLYTPCRILRLHPTIRQPLHTQNLGPAGVLLEIQST